VTTQTPSFKSIGLAILGLLFILFSTAITTYFFLSGGESVQALGFWMCVLSFTFWFGFYALGMRRLPIQYSIGTTAVLIVTIFVFAKRVIDDNVLQSKVVATEITLMSKSLAERFEHPEQLKPLAPSELQPAAHGTRGVFESEMKKTLADLYHLQLNQYLLDQQLYNQLIVLNNLENEASFKQAQADLAKLTSLTEDTKTKLANLTNDAQAKLTAHDIPDSAILDLLNSFLRGLDVRQQQLIESLDYQLKVYYTIAAMHRELLKYRKDWTIVNGQLRFKAELAYRDFYTAQLEHMQAVEDLTRYRNAVAIQKRRAQAR